MKSLEMDKKEEETLHLLHLLILKVLLEQSKKEKLLLNLPLLKLKELWQELQFKAPEINKTDLNLNSSREGNELTCIIQELD